MGWLDELQRSLGEPPPLLASRPPSRPRQPKPEIKSVWIQTRQPDNPDDVGAVRAAYYSVTDGVLTMRDEDGNATGEPRELLPGDDPRSVAGRLARAAWSNSSSDFNQRLIYPKTGMA
jgi:hypothetical protein